VIADGHKRLCIKRSRLRVLCKEEIKNSKNFRFFFQMFPYNLKSFCGFNVPNPTNNRIQTKLEVTGQFENFARSPFVIVYMRKIHCAGFLGMVMIYNEKKFTKLQ
jgi:hypothetical protein